MKRIFFCSSPKFFCSNGLLKEVSEVNKMNDSLQSELQVGAGGGGTEVMFEGSILHICFLFVRKHAERWKRASGLWRHCRRTF